MKVNVKESESNAAVRAYLEEIGVRIDTRATDKQNCPESCKTWHGKLRHKDGFEVSGTTPHNHGHNYTSTLTRTVEGRAITLVLSDWWNSFNSRYYAVGDGSLSQIKEFSMNDPRSIPGPYDVLSSYSPDFFANQDTFEEFCGNRGEDTDSRRAERCYFNLCQLAIRFQRFFSQEELLHLGEIAS